MKELRKASSENNFNQKKIISVAERKIERETEPKIIFT